MEDSAMWRFLNKELGVFGWFLTVLFFAVLIALLLPAVNSGPPSPKSRCSNKMRQLVLAMHLYAEEYGSLPPTFVADDDGKSMHSWRTLILPYIEEDALYAAYNFDEPWNGPNNRKLAEYIPDVFRCPAEENEEYTNYLAVVGPHTM